MGRFVEGIGVAFKDSFNIEVDLKVVLNMVNNNLDRKIEIFRFFQDFRVLVGHKVVVRIFLNLDKVS